MYVGGKNTDLQWSVSVNSDLIFRVSICTYEYQWRWVTKEGDGWLKMEMDGLAKQGDGWLSLGRMGG